MSNGGDNRVNQAWESILKDVWNDDSGALRNRLVETPREVFRSYGVEIPPDYDVRILENAPGRLNFVVPVKPPVAADISDKDVVELYTACPGTQLDFAGGR